ncbi:MAG TPA: hypothetical protein DD418_22120 [Pseudomonas sp.]|nr:hypothetical protein [Pseudomonas sp.]
MRATSLMLTAAVVPLFLLSLPLRAQSTNSVTLYEEYEKSVQRRSTVSGLGGDMFGDRVDLYSGRLEFAQVDADVPGSNGLQIMVGRRFAVQQSVADLGGNFADWDLDIPHLHGVFANTRRWATTGSGFTTYKRCSEFGAPPVELAQQSGTGGSFNPGEYWHGNFLYIPGVGDEEVLLRDAAVPVPGTGHAYPLVTQSGAAIRCIPRLMGDVVDGNEGFEVMMPDGTTYRFDRLVSRTTAEVVKSTPAPEFRQASEAEAEAQPMAFDGYLLRRSEVWLLPTLVTDRFGNTVTYNWSSGDAWVLNSIVASDGRSLTFTYVGGNYPNRIATVSSGGRTWSYSYTGNRLSQVTQPDGSTWSFNLEQIRFMPNYVEGGGCGGGGSPMYAGRTGTLTHPSGAIGSFTVVPVVQGRSWVPEDCVNFNYPAGNPGYDRYPIQYVQAAISVRKLSGPGLPAAGLQWTYGYGPPNSCYSSQCTSASPTIRTVSVTDPEGRATRYMFGNRFQVNEGKLLQVDEGWNGSTAMRTVARTYADPAGGPYPGAIGASIQTRSDSYLSTRHTPLRRQVTTQQGRIFTWEVAADCGGVPYCFDIRARPTKVIQTSSP